MAYVRWSDFIVKHYGHNFYLISCNFLSADPTTVQSKTARRREAKFQLKTNCQCTRAATRFSAPPASDV